MLIGALDEIYSAFNKMNIYESRSNLSIIQKIISYRQNDPYKNYLNHTNESELGQNAVKKIDEILLHRQPIVRKNDLYEKSCRMIRERLNEIKLIINKHATEGFLSEETMIITFNSFIKDINDTANTLSDFHNRLKNKNNISHIEYRVMQMYEKKCKNLVNYAQEYFEKFIEPRALEEQTNKIGEILTYYLDYMDKIKPFAKKFIENEKILWCKNLEQYGELINTLHQEMMPMLEGDFAKLYEQITPNELAKNLTGYYEILVDFFKDLLSYEKKGFEKSNSLEEHVANTSAYFFKVYEKIYEISKNCIIMDWIRGEKLKEKIKEYALDNILYELKFHKRKGIFNPKENPEGLRGALREYAEYINISDSTYFSDGKAILESEWYL